MNRPSPFSVGKLPAEHLERLLDRVPQGDRRLLLGPRLGEDAAVIEMGNACLVAKTDPITFAIEKIGWYAVHINANDVAVLGATPKWFLATLLLPETKTDPELVDEIFSDILDACQELIVTLCGGHTEITYGLERPIVVGQMLGEVPREKLLRKDSLRPGDRVLLTHGVAIEGTAVIAREKQLELSGRLTRQVLREAEELLFHPGISVVKAAQTAASTGAVKAMHDPTEGGVLAGLMELAQAATLGIRVFANQVPVLPQTAKVCSALGLDPLALLASGALLIGLPAEGVETVKETLQASGIPSTVVAELLPLEHGYQLQEGAEIHPMSFPERDELAKLF